MTYDEKLDAILAGLAALTARVATIETQLGDTPAPNPTPAPAPTGGLFQFVRPVPEVPRYGEGFIMAKPDAAEVVKRALYGVRWTGDVPLLPADLDARWALIEKLKAADPDVLPFYSMLDPEFCGVALLTNVISPHTFDAPTFGLTAKTRASYAGVTTQSFIEANLRVEAGPSGS